MTADPPTDEAAAAVVDALVPLLGIPMDPAWRAAVIANVRTVMAAADLVAAFPLEDAVEPAPVFRA